MNDFDKKFRPELSKRQTLAWRTIALDGVDELMYGGAKGGGKSVFLCYWCYARAYAMAQRFFPEKPDFPVPVGFMGRKVAKDFRDTTLQTWKRFIPAHRYTIKGNPAVITIADRVQIQTGGLDKREDIEKFNSAELAFYAIDQAEETLIDDINTLRAASHNRLIINGYSFPGKGLFTANPAQCWLKEEFILNPTKNRRFVQALPSDNPWLSKKYVETLKDTFKHRPDLLRAYLHGDWDAFEGEDQVILGRWIQEAYMRRSQYWPYIKTYIVIDCARFGDDETVILLMENTDIKEKIVMPFCRHQDISGRAAALSHQNDECTIVVESVGSDIGAAVIDDLVEMGKDVLQFNPALPATKKEEYYSLRCEGWHNAAKVLSDGVIDKNIMVCITKNEPALEQNYGMDTTMFGQLCTPHYKWRAGKLVVEPKEETKKRLGRSPDHGDAYMIALWAFPYISVKKSMENERRNLVRKDPMMM